MSPARRVLSVDDDPGVASTLEEALGDLGYATRIAGTGPDALHLVPEFRLDVVLLDLAMPGMSGDGVLERLHQTDPDLPVIMVTANTDLKLAQRTLAQGALDYIVKPFDLERLAAVLEAALAYRD